MKEYKYKLVIFDMDGTILDTLEDLNNSLNYALNDCGFPLRSRAEVRKFLGNGIRRLVECGVPKTATPRQTEQTFACFNEYYRLHCADATKPYKGIDEVIHELHLQGIRTAVVSNKADYAVAKLCNQYFEGMFDCFAGARDGVRLKPFPDSVNEVLEKLSIERSRAVYIGDSEVDIQTAQNAELDCICVGWGFRDKEELVANGATKIASNMDELMQMILKPV